MATRRKKRIPTASAPAEPPRWRPIAHALATDLLALSLLLELAGMATEEEERARHLEAARRALTEGDRRLQALHQAVQLEEGARDIEAARQTLTEREGRLQALRQALQRLDERSPRPEQPTGSKPRTRKSGKNVRRAGGG